MRVLYVTSEVSPLVKTGGLADVSAALPTALGGLDIDVRLLVPGYPQALERASRLEEVSRYEDFLGLGDTRLLSGRLPGGGAHIWLVDNPALYGRRGGIYQDGNGNDWCDNALRFALLNHMAEKISDGAAHDGWRPDIVHVHDWHAALLPFLLSTRMRPRPATVLTIHNLAYQGIFAPETLQQLGMSNQLKAYAALEFYGRLSFLKAGICSADAVTTVSPTYAKEVLTPEYGCGLDAVLRNRVSVMGIMNGVDYSVWAPANDSHLARTYSSTHIAGKRACKIALQDEMALNPSSEKPLVAFMSRLAHQKMPDVVLEALPPLLAEGIQFALVAEGDSHYERGFRELAAAYPGQVSVHVGYDEPLAHRVLAGADILLHPSRYEPCGLMPIYAMRYGTLPLVRKCGGTADSVVDAIEDTVNCGKATGFSFEHATARDLIECIRRSLHLYCQPTVWRKIQICAMRQDFGWERPAQAYVDLYRTLAVHQTGERCYKNGGYWGRSTRASIVPRQSASNP